MVNPFNYQGPVAGESLIDRRQELHDLQRAGANRVAVRLAAPRRFGKTSVLRAHIAQMTEAGHRAVLVDFSRVTTYADAVARLAAAYSRLPADPTGAVARWVARLGLTIGSGPAALHLAPRAELRPHDAQAALLELLDLPQRLHDHDQGFTLVCMDEFQDLLVAGDGLDGLFRSVLQHQGHSAAYVYAGSQPSLMRALFADRERPFYGQARPMELPPLPFDEALADLEATLHRHGLDPQGHVADLLQFTGGHPQRTILVAHHLYDALEEQALHPVLVALDRALAEADDALQATWDGLNRAEQIVTAAVADGRPPTGRRLADDHQMPRSTLANATNRLVADGQVLRRAPASRQVALVDPLLGEWLRRRSARL